MSIFRCEECGCIENTACCDYWCRKDNDKTDHRALCSECDPDIGKWHGEFPKRPASGYCIGADGFLYDKESVEAGRVKHTKIVGVVPGNTRFPEPIVAPEWDGETGEE